MTIPPQLSPIASSLLLLVALGSLAACGKKPEAQAAAPAADAPPMSRESPPAAKSDIARQALQPATAYVSAQVGRDSAPIAGLPDPLETMRSMYWAKAKRDDALLAYDFLPAYRQQSDTFKRADLIKANTAQLDTAFAASQAKTLYALETVNDSKVSVGRYDPKERGFEVRLDYKEEEYYRLLKQNESRSNPQPEWALVVLGAATDPAEKGKRLFYRPGTEAEARAIEAKLAQSANGATGSIYVPATRLGHMLASVPSAGLTQQDPTSVFVMDGVIVRLGPTRDALFTIDSQQLGGEVEVRSDRVRKLLGLPIVVKFDHRYL